MALTKQEKAEKLLIKAINTMPFTPEQKAEILAKMEVEDDEELDVNDILKGALAYGKNMLGEDFKKDLETKTAEIEGATRKEIFGSVKKQLIKSSGDLIKAEDLEEINTYSGIADLYTKRVKESMSGDGLQFKEINDTLNKQIEELKENFEKEKQSLIKEKEDVIKGYEYKEIKSNVAQKFSKLIGERNFVEKNSDIILEAGLLKAEQLFDFAKDENGEIYPLKKGTSERIKNESGTQLITMDDVANDILGKFTVAESLPPKTPNIPDEEKNLTRAERQSRAMAQ